MLSTGYFPGSWAEGYTVPLHKKATLTMLISVLNNRVNKWCEENSIRTDAQFGFRNNFSTTDAVFALHTLI